MINNEMKSVEVLTYSEVNNVGQKRMGEPTTKTVDMFIKIYSQSNVADPRYLDVDLIALSKDYEISTSNVIKVENDKYNVKFILKTPRYLVLYLKKV